NRSWIGWLCLACGSRILRRRIRSGPIRSWSKGRGREHKKHERSIAACESPEFCVRQEPARLRTQGEERWKHSRSRFRNTAFPMLLNDGLVNDGPVSKGPVRTVSCDVLQRQ